MKTIFRKPAAGILFIDNVQKLVPDGYATDINKLDKLFSEMDKMGNDPIVVLSGLTEGFGSFLDKNPSIRNRFNYFFLLPEYSVTDLLEICKRKLAAYSLSLSEESEARLKGLFKHAVKYKDESFGNGHLSSATAEAIFKAYLSRIGKGDPDNNIVSNDDIIGEVEIERPVEEIMAELDSFIGMDEVKEAVREIARQIASNKEREARGLGGAEKPAMNLVLTGNPGTGKTTVARKLGEVLAALGFIDNGHVIEVDRSQMVGQYKGQTAIQVTDLCNKAMGGILFVDEAYTLSQSSEIGSSDQYGKEAIETLMKRMEDDRGKFVVIAAGYKNLMDQFLDVNPGLKSRFDKNIDIPDYKPDELFRIFLMFAKKKKYKFTDDALENAQKAIKLIYEGRDKNFGNGREMRKLFDATVARFSNRINSIPAAEQTNQLLTTITAEDIPYEEQSDKSIDEIMGKLNELVGLKGVKDKITELVHYINLENKRAKDGGKKTALNLNMVFTGNPGTGKTTVARIMADVFKSLGLLSRGHLVEVDSSHLVAGYKGQTSLKTNKTIDSSMGGLLFIDEAYTLSQGGGDGFGKEAIDTLLKRVEDDRGRFISIIAGYSNEMREFLDVNPGLQSRYTNVIHFEDYKAEELKEILIRMIGGKGFRIDEDTDKRLDSFFKSIYNGRDKNFGNGREVRNIFESALQRQSTRLAEKMNAGEDVDDQLNLLTYEDIAGSSEKEKSVEEILAELDGFIGMDNVKQMVREIARKIEIDNERVKRGIGSADKSGVHLVITGNPGTGKTTVARKLGEIFKAIGFLSSGQVNEVDKSGMVSQYKGETPKLVNKQCDKAMGGILFVDEAYALSPPSDIGQKDELGVQAIEALMKRMEDDRGKFVTIAAGYKEEMEGFLEANPGMKSRFDYYLHIEDYKPDELYKIFNVAFAKKKKYTLSPEADEKIKLVIEDIYSRRDKNFANAREMRKLFNTITSKMSDRISNIPQNELTDEMFTTILPEDIPFEGAKTRSIDDIFAQLDELIGLDGIKSELRALTNYLRVEKKRAELGGKETAVNTHFIFTGNPGTGKTTVARIVADILKALGLLTKGQLVEVDRSNLVASYSGQTSPKTNKTIDNAIGGVLFIDEAYTLSRAGANDTFGREAIDTLLKRVEDDRGKFVAIAAGYTNEMNEFLETNPGLKSRFTNVINFEDYTPDEMLQIFMLFVRKKKMILEDGVGDHLYEKFTSMYQNRDKNFGNARDVRNIFEKALKMQSTRIAGMLDSPEFNEDELNKIKVEDFD